MKRSGGKLRSKDMVRSDVIMGPGGVLRAEGIYVIRRHLMSEGIRWSSEVR